MALRHGFVAAKTAGANVNQKPVTSGTFAASSATIAHGLHSPAQSTCRLNRQTRMSRCHPSFLISLRLEPAHTPVATACRRSSESGHCGVRCSKRLKGCTNCTEEFKKVHGRCLGHQSLKWQLLLK